MNGQKPGIGLPSAYVCPEPDSGMFCIHHTRKGPLQSLYVEYSAQVLLLTSVFASAPPAPE